MSPAIPPVILGLGNPGPQFDWTPHNAGFSVLDLVAAQSRRQFEMDSKLEALTAVVELAGQSCLLLKPQTGMNDSGNTLAALAARLDVSVQSLRLLLIYDDLSLPMGRLKVADSGRAAGHNGVSSVIQARAADVVFDRVKLGIGPDPGGEHRYEYVLGPLDPARREVYVKALEAAAQAVSIWPSAPIEQVKNRLNGLDLRN